MNTWPETAGCLCARMSRGFNGQDAMGLLVVITSHGKQSANLYMGGVASTLMERQYKSPDDLIVEEQPKPKRKYIVRRLTPTECARLQGFPDWWTDGADGSDSAKYKLWGNGISLPCAYDVLNRIAKEVKQNANPLEKADKP